MIVPSLFITQAFSMMIFQSIVTFQNSLSTSRQIAQAPTTIQDPATMTQSANTSVSYSIFPQLTGIKLTPDQQTKLNRVAQETVTKIAAKLPPEKQQKFLGSIQEKKDLRSAIQDIGFDFSIMTQIFPVMESTKSEVSAILTPEQRVQFEKQSPQQPTGFSGSTKK